MSNSHDEAATRGSGEERSPVERASGALDPRWEQELLAGQEAEGEQGGLDADLAFVHLLRHAREPEPLPDGELERVWSAIHEAVAPLPWWRRRWLMWAAPVAAAAAVLVVVVLPGDEGLQVAKQELPAASTPAGHGADGAVALAEDAAGGGSGARAPGSSPAPVGAAAEPAMEAGEAGAAVAAELESATATRAAAGSGSAALERQFALLELDARVALAAGIDHERGTLRHELLAYAKRGGR